MKRIAKHELAAGILFFVACGWLIVDLVLSFPQGVASLWPLIPMFAAIVWYIGIEHVRSKEETPGLADIRAE